MAKTVGDFFIERLHQWGVRRIYGYPGDGINGVFGALQRAEGKIEFIQARHEEMAAFMASAHAKFTGELGVCIATSGPGATHLVTGLYDARADHMPVLAIAGQQARMALGGHYQQEVDLAALFKDVAGAFVHTATMPAQVRHLTDRAVRIAIAERRVTGPGCLRPILRLGHDDNRRRADRSRLPRHRDRSGVCGRGGEAMAGLHRVRGQARRRWPKLRGDRPGASGTG
jgi:glyoxylate carboligase